MRANLKAVVILFIGMGLGALGYWGVGQVRHAAPSAAGKAMTAEAGRKPLYWYDPMVPDQHFDKPGKSPFMDMDLVPKYADEGGGVDTVAIDPRVAQNLGVRTAEVTSGKLWRRIDTVGTVAPDDSRVQVVQARAEGYVERLVRRVPNEPVKKGELLAEVYSPALLAAQEEYRLVLKRNDDPAWRDAARQRLSLLGVSEAQIAALENGGQPTRRVAYYAPVSGILSEVTARDGAAVSSGMPMFSIADYGQVWVLAEVVEDQAAWIKPGKSVEVTFPALPGKVVEGTVDTLYPRLNAEARTLQARIRLANPGLALKPGMYANVTLYGGASEEHVLVPAEAVIATGTRKIVLLAEDKGRFRPVEVKTGMENDGKVAILAGLQGGEKVVVSGQFLIESEANLKGVLGRMAGSGVEAKPGAQAAPQTWSGAGKITKVNAATGELEMAHEPIPALQWPAMVMPFNVRDKAMLKGLKAGDAVSFDLARAGDGFSVVAIRPAGK
jgi:Cu(I)/Ag(I) efflux system membrane fusion protein